MTARPTSEQQSQETEQARPADPCTMVIFGGAGDLAKRKLLPALYNLLSYKLLPPAFSIIGIGRDPFTHDTYREQLTHAVHEFATTTVDGTLWKDIQDRIFYMSGEFTDPATYQQLAALIGEVEHKQGAGGHILFYLATPPNFFGKIVLQLGEAGLTREEGGRWRRVIIEKPFGRDLASAIALNEEIHRVLTESQIYRIDHYLGKETVQNILVLRFVNGILEPIWNRRYIDHIQILVAESIGIEERGAYYDHAGVLRDVMQNHIFQLLALVAMEPPLSFEGDAVRSEKVKVLQAVRPMRPEEILQNTARGQYADGDHDGRKLVGYRNEPHVSPTSSTETYAAMKLFVDNWRWADVPFFLRSGKRLPRRATEIMIQFRRAPLLLLRHVAANEFEPNRLVLRIQPDEGITMQLKAKIPGPSLRVKQVNLNFSYKDFGPTTAATGYETLLYDSMIGNSTLFSRSDMMEAAWKIATPILDVWGALPPRDFPNYSAGSWGPAAGDELIQREERRWSNPE